MSYNHITIVSNHTSTVWQGLPAASTTGWRGLSETIPPNKDYRRARG
jgi:hypothetical protein